MAATVFLALFVVSQNTAVLGMGARLAHPESKAVLVFVSLSRFGHPSVEQQVRSR